jgi:hypothetical protein
MAIPYTSSSDIPLSLGTLILLKWSDVEGRVHYFRLIDRVSSKWREFGYLFGQNGNQMDAVEDEYRGKVRQCWCAVMKEWLKKGGTAEYPITWRGLLTVLVDLEYIEEARELQEVLALVTPPPPPPSPQTLPPTFPVEALTEGMLSVEAQVKETLPVEAQVKETLPVEAQVEVTLPNEAQAEGALPVVAQAEGTLLLTSSQAHPLLVYLYRGHYSLPSFSRARCLFPSLLTQLQTHNLAYEIHPDSEVD